MNHYNFEDTLTNFEKDVSKIPLNKLLIKSVYAFGGNYKIWGKLIMLFMVILNDVI